MLLEDGKITMSACRIEPQSFRELFFNATKNTVTFDAPEQQPGEVLNLGAGNFPISGACNLDKPDWIAPYLDFKNESISAIHAYHFLEHLTGDEVIDQIREVDRVLVNGGLFYYAVPYAMAPIAFMDVTHKTFWTEETMRTLLESRGYNSEYSSNHSSRLRQYSQIIAGITSQNLTVIGILIKIKV
jgi:SAM-dependent methyltransferase